jgi:predicted aspartyl protease
MMNTANGVSNGCTTTISELKVGEFVFTNVTALIVPSLSQPLLGMNVLQAFNIEQKNGEMKLSAREPK